MPGSSGSSNQRRLRSFVAMDGERFGRRSCCASIPHPAGEATMARRPVSEERAPAMTGVRRNWMMKFAKDYQGVKSLDAGVGEARLDGAHDATVHAAT